ALTHEDWGEALDHALAAWRVSRHPKLALLVREISKRAGASFKPPYARTSKAFEKAWLRLADSDASAVATGWLAETFGKKLLDAFNPFWQRLDRLRRRPHDPRIAAAATEALRQGKYGGANREDSRRIYAPMLDLIRDTQDASLAESLGRIGAAPRSRRASTRRFLSDQLPPLAEELRALQPRTKIDDTVITTVVDQWLKRGSVARGTTDSASMLEYVLANPHDEDARAILGDAWLTEESPRGQLVALERRGCRPHDRAWKRLMRAHLRAWVGDDIASILANPKFRGGLLEEAALRPTSSASQETWQRAAVDDRFATLRRFWIGRGSHTWYARLLGAPVLRDLRHVELRTETLVQTLLAGPPRSYEMLHFRYDPPVARLQELGVAFPSVTGLGVPHATTREDLLDRAEAAGWRNRLTEIAFEDVPAYEGVVLESWISTPRVYPILPYLDWFIEHFPALRRLEVSRDSYHHAISVAYVRKEAGWILELCCDPWATHHRQSIYDGRTWFTFEPGQPDFFRLPQRVCAVRADRSPNDAFLVALEKAWGVPVSSF
ncbi:MAG: hypothetical protein AAGA48_34355, partial [Myxococcota bacterium]